MNFRKGGHSNPKNFVADFSTSQKKGNIVFRKFIRDTFELNISVQQSSFMSSKLCEFFLVRSEGLGHSFQKIYNIIWPKEALHSPETPSDSSVREEERNQPTHCSG